MRLGLSQWSVRQWFRSGTMDVEKFLKYAKELGCEGVELLDTFWKDDEEKRRAPALLKKYGLQLSCYSLSNDFADDDPAKRKAQVDYMRAGIDDMAMLGTKVSRVFGGNPKEGTSYEKARDYIIEGLRAASAYAATKGVVLALENHGRLCGKADQVLDLIAAVGSKSFRANPDLANFTGVMDDPVQATRKLAKYTVHVHCKDILVVPPDQVAQGERTRSDGTALRGVALGEGSVDLPACLQALGEAGFTGFLSVEYEGREDPQTGVPKSVEYVNRLLKR